MKSEEPLKTSGTVAGALTTELMSRARAGDDMAFRALTEPHRRELRAHCYRMLGCLQDSEEALQDTLLAAWQGLEGFEERASLRTWLYRIATNRCLNTLRSASRRPSKEWDIPGLVPPETTRLGEVAWIEPFPDENGETLLGTTPGPEVRYERAESIALAFVTALQRLPPRQTAVLILRDVLGFEASEVAGMLDSTLDSINSALKRARAGLQPQHTDRAPAPVSGSAQEDAIVTEFVRAYESADLDALVALLTDDVFIAMPPMLLEYVGKTLARSFCGLILNSGRRFELMPTRANGQPAFGVYLRTPSGPRPGIGFFALQLSGDGIAALIRFEASVLPWFGLPAALVD